MYKTDFACAGFGRSHGDSNAGCHGAWLKAECPSRKRSDKFEFVGIRPLCHIRDISPFRGEKYFIKSDIKRFAPERGDVSSADRGVTCVNFIPLFILSIGQFALFCFNFFYLSTFALMPRGH